MTGEEPRFPVELPEALAARFRPGRLLGQGGMGAVFEAEDLERGRRVALKLMTLGPGDAKALIRFRREAEALARLEHPGILRIHETGVIEGVPFLVTELLEGRSLAQAPPAGWDLDELLLQVAAGLEVVHAAGMVHRDLKPSNVMVTKEGRAVLIDFGLVHDLDRTRITATSQAVGTFAFMAPEVLRGGQVGPATDWYAWGLTLYSAHERRLPFRTEELLAVTRGEPLPALDFTSLQPGHPTRAVIEACVQDDPGSRPTSRGQVLELIRTRPDLRGTDVIVARDPEVGVLTAVVSSGSQAGARQQSPGIRTGPGRRPLAALAVLLSGAALAAGWWGSGTLGPGPDTSGEPAPQGGGPLVPPGLPARLRAELEGRMVSFLDPEGDLEEHGPDGAELGWSQFMEPDPARWGDQLRHLPELRAVLDRMSDGGRIDRLSTGQREDLQAVDRWYRDLGFSGPLRFHLEAAPGPGEISTSPDLQKILGPGVQAPPRLGGWAARAVTLHRKARDLYRRLDEQFQRVDRGGEAPPGFPALPARLRLGLGLNLGATLESTAAAPLARTEMARWMVDVTEAHAGALFAAARSIREEPGTRTWLAAVFAQLARSPLGAWFGPRPFGPWRDLLGGTPVTPEGWLLSAAVQEMAIFVRQKSGVRWDTTRSEERNAWELALVTGGGGVSLGRSRAVRGLLACLLEIEDRDRIRQVFRVEGEGLLADEERDALEALVLVMAAWAQEAEIPARDRYRVSRALARVRLRREELGPRQARLADRVMPQLLELMGPGTAEPPTGAQLPDASR